MHSGYVEAIDKIFNKLSKQGVNPKTLPTAIYARKSTKDESQISLETQIEACKAQIRDEKRLRIVQVYQEDRISGYHMENRKEFSKLLEELQKGNIKVIVYYSVDRETRNEDDGIFLDKEFDRLDSLQIYATQYFENNANGRFLKSIVRRNGQREVESGSEKVKDSLRTVTQELRATGARPPYGYKVVKKHYVENKKESPAIKIIFESAAKGLTIPSISMILTKQGYLTRAGNRFSKSTIANILKNEKYKGIYIYDKKGGRKSPYRIARDDFGEVRVEKGIPQIISEELFEKAQKALSKKGKKKPNRDYQTYLLTGVLKCGTCGSLMHGEASVGGHSRKRYCHYKCPRGSNCKSSIRKEYIERATAEVLADAFNKVYSNNISSLTMTRKINSSKKNEVATLDNQISRLKKELMMSVMSLANLTREDSIALVNDYINQKQDLINELETKRLALDSYQASVSKTSSYNPITAEEVLSNQDLFENLLHLFVADITLEKDCVIFSLNDLRR